uniref:Uncharacterized protein n=1 Tax=Oryza punctata TaxID=4537 RepID=A0A0E0MNE9_ORYPU
MAPSAAAATSSSSSYTDASISSSDSPFSPESDRRRHHHHHHRSHRKDAAASSSSSSSLKVRKDRRSRHKRRRREQRRSPSDDDSYRRASSYFLPHSRQIALTGTSGAFMGSESHVKAPRHSNFLDAPRSGEESLQNLLPASQGMGAKAKRRLIQARKMHRREKEKLVILAGAEGKEM